MDNNPVEDVIDEMMDAYWRTQADTLNPEAGEMLNKALDVWSNEGGSTDTQVPQLRGRTKKRLKTALPTGKT